MMKTHWKLLIGILVVMLTASMIAAAQEDDEVELTVEIIGTVDQLSADGIIVDGMTIAPAGAFNPSDLSIGDRVVVVGELLDDNTVQASDLEILAQDDDGDDDDDDDDADEEEGVTVVVCHAPPGNPDKAHTITVGENAVDNHLRHGDTEGACVGDEDAVENDDPDDDEDGVCNTERRHPVAASLAEEFDYDRATIQSWHCDGFGYGEIARALLIEEALEGEVSAEEVLARKSDGEGWGRIIRDYGLHPRDLAPGRVLGQGRDRGNGNGNANGNGNGNANGNGNGNANGNGRGGDDGDDDDDD